MCSYVNINMDDGDATSTSIPNCVLLDNSNVETTSNDKLESAKIQEYADEATLVDFAANRNYTLMVSVYDEEAGKFSATSTEFKYIGRKIGRNSLDLGSL
jgi:hypothetical protein